MLLAILREKLCFPEFCVQIGYSSFFFLWFFIWQKHGNWKHFESVNDKTMLCHGHYQVCLPCETEQKRCHSDIHSHRNSYNFNSKFSLVHYSDVIMNCVSNHLRHNDLLNRLFRRRSKTTSKLRITCLCEGNSPATGEFSHKWPVTRKMFPFDGREHAV